MNDVEVAIDMRMPIFDQVEQKVMLFKRCPKFWYIIRSESIPRKHIFLTWWVVETSPCWRLWCIWRICFHISIHIWIFQYLKFWNFGISKRSACNYETWQYHNFEMQLKLKIFRVGSMGIFPRSSLVTIFVLPISTNSTARCSQSISLYNVNHLSLHTKN